MSLENDISRLYAAKHFAQHLQLEQLQIQKETPFVKQWQDIFTKHGKSLLTEVEKYEQEFKQKENPTEAELQQQEAIIQQIFTKESDAIKTEVTKTYEDLRTAGALTPEDEKDYHDFMHEFTPEEVPMLAFGIDKQEAQEQIPEQQDEQHNIYLASAGINTPEGKTAWTIAHHAGYHFTKIIYYEDDACKIATKCSPDRMNPQPVKVKPLELEQHILAAIIEGLNFDSIQELITNQNKERFCQKATQWLSKEINERLAKAIEFNLLDAVFIKKLSDGQIQLKLDKKEPY